MQEEQCTPRNLTAYTIGALGVVYGDIGTSPLYAIKESLNPSHGVAFGIANVYGIISLVFWSLALVVTCKYLNFIMKADNRGEGGIMTLLSLLLPKYASKKTPKERRSRKFVLALGVVGAGLLYGDSSITPAISVLSALEGLNVATNSFEHIVVPLTIAILVALFYVQKRGTTSIGAIFGPLMLVWFLSIAASGLPWIFKHKEILLSLNPAYAAGFLIKHKLHSLVILGSVVLCITGTEALYADMGHFGRKPIKFGWYLVVWPALILNYMGQGAIVLERGADAISNPFYALVSDSKFTLYPMVAIATAATVIASQAMISGAFSLTQQAVQLGFMPRMTIMHTSRSTEGQIYVPMVNWLLMAACVLLVLWFKESSNLASAYGIAVMGTMTITSILYYLVSTRIWNWPVMFALPLLLCFITVDLTFFTATLGKILHGGWVPVSIAIVLFAIMTTWKRGREFIADKMAETSTPLKEFFSVIDHNDPPRLDGTAVFMSLTRDIAPSVLLQFYKHNKALHRKVLLLSITTENTPDVPGTDRVRVTELEHGFVKIHARYGYMERPDIEEVLELAQCSGLSLDRSDLSFFLGRESFVRTGHSGMMRWRKRLFIFLSKNAKSAMEFFHLPPDRVIEIGAQIRI